MTQPAGPGAPAERSKPGTITGPGSLRGQGGGNGSAPGGLATLVDPAGDPAGADPAGAGIPPGEPLASLAARHQLEPTSTRPPWPKYLRMLWQRRQFITGFATASNIAMYSEARLGQLWQVLTPLLNAGVYFLIFGVLLGVSRGVPDYIPFLVTGVFVFNFTQRACITASTVMRDSLPLIRALPFPRACLPLGYVLIELQQLLLSFAVLVVIVLASGEPLTGYWLLLIPILVLQSLFNVGCSFMLARWGSGFDDVSQLLPFVVRTWMYASGVIFSIATTLRLVGVAKLGRLPTIAYLMQINPAAVYITLVRNALLFKQRISWPGYHVFNSVNCKLYKQAANSSYFPAPKPPPAGTPLSPTLAAQHNTYLTYSSYCHGIISENGLWAWGIGWALLAVVAGFFLFWQAETRYGRG